MQRSHMQLLDMLGDDADRLCGVLLETLSSLQRFQTADDVQRRLERLCKDAQITSMLQPSSYCFGCVRHTSCTDAQWSGQPSASDSWLEITAQPKLLFLYKLARGVARRSFGLNVARMAVRRAFPSLAAHCD